MQERDIIIEVLEALEDGRPIRAKDLEKKVRMSSRSLYKALSYLEMIGAIEKKKVHSTRATGIEYNLSQDFGNKNLDDILSIVNKLILESFKQYDDAEEDQKETIFDTYLSSIVGLLKSYKKFRKNKEK